MDDFKADFKPEWIKVKLNSLGIKYAQKLGAALAKNYMTTSQIRNVYSEVKRIQATMKGISLTESTTEEHKLKVDLKMDKAYRSFLLLSPKVAYAARRGGGRGIELFQKEFDKMYTAVAECGEHNGELKGKLFKDAFWRFCDLFEAVLAFHKASGGRD
ncbi:type III-A CRISPR-associated protein Csm2 [Saprospira sp. CCB-QB6]|uniref:type III-A CRISPR-associated protein Csm2 n=1 Tax=Saprospira sp. CCB-QB6 TaxID=3023936 RepID=UPI002349C69C|nr:type III-A CRISPR-associated protein Csm2 [Saprospira sp. CCB-QB6]WCL81678.1 type III-A CRISPR-associated protein Csm2 [Saprospira sp. CCB-QB6]